MVFDFLKPGIDILIEKYNYSPGETVKGKVVLKLKKPTKAKQLKVGLIAERKIRETQVISGKTSIRERNEIAYRFEMPLDGEKEYFSGEYNFEIKIPTSLAQANLPEGVAGDIIKSIQILAGKESALFWYIVAYLDIPLGLDISKRVQINIA
jgi:hypothetical protein